MGVARNRHTAFGLLSRLAWRNIWRQARRSMVLIGAVAVAVFAFIAMAALTGGWLVQMVENVIEMEGGHIYIARKGFHQNPQIRYRIDHPEQVAAVLDSIPGIRYEARVQLTGMAQSARKTTGALVIGLDPGRTLLDPEITEGTFLLSDGDNRQIVIGRAMAERLELRLGDRMVLMAHDLENNVTADAFRVVGLFRAPSIEFERSAVYLTLPAAQKLVGYTHEVNRFVVRVERPREEDAIRQEIVRRLDTSALEVLSWRDINPLVDLSIAFMDYMLLLMGLILFVAVAFSLINLFLMVIFERMREFGVMLALGLRPRQLRFTLYLEGAYMTVVGLTLGALISLIVLGLWAHYGLDLSAFSEGLRAYGLRPVLYPHLEWRWIYEGIALVLVVVFLSLLYPAFKASRYEVVDALRHM